MGVHTNCNGRRIVPEVSVAMFEWVMAVDLHAALRSTSHRAGLAKIERD